MLRLQKERLAQAKTGSKIIDERLQKDLELQALSGKKIDTTDVSTKTKEKVVSKGEEKINLPSGKVVDVTEEIVQYLPTSATKTKPATQRKSIQLSDDETSKPSDIRPPSRRKTIQISDDEEAEVVPVRVPSRRKTIQISDEEAEVVPVRVPSKTKKLVETISKPIIEEKIVIEEPKQTVKDIAKTKKVVETISKPTKQIITAKDIAKPEKVELIVEAKPEIEIKVKKVDKEPIRTVETQPTEVMKEMEEQYVKTSTKESVIEKLRKETEKVKPYGKPTTMKMKPEEIVKPDLKSVEFPITKEARMTIREFLDSMKEKEPQRILPTEATEQEQKEFESISVKAPKLKPKTAPPKTISSGKEEEESEPKSGDVKRETIQYLQENIDRIAEGSARSKTENVFTLEQLREFATKLGIKVGTANKAKLVDTIRTYIKENQ
jgi:hypothetical protein